MERREAVMNHQIEELELNPSPNQTTRGSEVPDTEAHIKALRDCRRWSRGGGRWTAKRYWVSWRRHCGRMFSCRNGRRKPWRCGSCIFVLVSKGDRADRAFAQDAGGSMRCFPDAAQDGQGSPKDILFFWAKRRWEIISSNAKLLFIQGKVSSFLKWSKKYELWNRLHCESIKGHGLDLQAATSNAHDPFP